MFANPTTKYFAPYCKQCGVPKDWTVKTENGITVRVFFCRECK